MYVNFPDSYKCDEQISGAKTIRIENVALEKRYGGVVPDVVVYSGGKSLFIEIFVTHRIDDKKLDKLRETKISTIEIDLSKKTEIITTEELTDILLNDSEEKHWKYNNFSAESFQKFMSVADRKSIVPRGFALHVDNCPIKSRKWNGRPYANVMKDCLYCEYCVSYTEYVYCTGRARIATINDFRIPEGERIRTSDLKEICYIK